MKYSEREKASHFIKTKKFKKRELSNSNEKEEATEN